MPHEPCSQVSDIPMRSLGNGVEFQVIPGHLSRVENKRRLDTPTEPLQPDSPWCNLPYAGVIEQNFVPLLGCWITLEVRNLPMIKRSFTFPTLLLDKSLLSQTCHLNLELPQYATFCGPQQYVPQLPLRENHEVEPAFAGDGTDE